MVDLTTDTINDNNKQSDIWVKIGSLILYTADKNILTSGDWLNDKLINAAQYLLKNQFSCTSISGFQDTLLQITSTFEIEASRPFIQCLNLSGSHWITISTLQCPQDTVRVYDSLNMLLPSSIERVIADLMHSSNKTITVEYANVQQQHGGNDCGLFAAANARALCAGEDPVAYNFDQKLMRPHLTKALQNKCLEEFPSKRRKVKSSLIRKSLIKIYCVCRLPNDGRLMIECSKCSKWFHADCLKVSKKTTKSSEPWFCSFCKEN